LNEGYDYSFAFLYGKKCKGQKSIKREKVIGKVVYTFSHLEITNIVSYNVIKKTWPSPPSLKGRGEKKGNRAYGPKFFLMMS